jgi:hypothetical protein
MNLLYCVNGIVMGAHDSLQNVPASAYGDTVRIIPYDGLMSDLPRIGPPPPDDVRAKDTRQYGEPVETPEILTAFASQVRFDTVTAGIVWNSIPVKTDRVSQMLINGLAVYAATLPNTNTIDFTQDGVAYQFTAAQAPDLNNQVNSFVQSCRTAEAACLADLSSATPTMTTYADIEAQFSGLKSKTLAAWRKK